MQFMSNLARPTFFVPGSSSSTTMNQHKNNKLRELRTIKQKPVLFQFSSCLILKLEVSFDMFLIFCWKRFIVILLYYTVEWLLFY